MANLSVLTFSRDDVNTVMGLIDSLYDYADEVLLIDSSRAENSEKILNFKRSKKLEKLRIIHAIALGMPDPLFEYGKSKCKGDWVFLVGSDERPNNRLKKDLRRIIKSAKASAFAIEEREGRLSVLQVRLYKKSKARFKGLVHEQPSIYGRIERLPNRYYIDHRKEIGRNSWREYEKIDKFERLTYGLFNKKIAEYLFKMSLEKNVEPLPIRLLGLYERLGNKKQEQELSNLDYFLWYFGRELTYAIKQKSLKNLIMLLPREVRRNMQIMRWRSEPDGDEIFEISKIIHKIGITKFLGLEKESTLTAYNRKYEKSKQGIELLMKMLKDKYEEEHANRS